MQICGQKICVIRVIRVPKNKETRERVMRYALCVMRYALWVMRYGLTERGLFNRTKSIQQRSAQPSKPSKPSQRLIRVNL